MKTTHEELASPDSFVSAPWNPGQASRPRDRAMTRPHCIALLSGRQSGPAATERVRWLRLLQLEVLGWVAPLRWPFLPRGQGVRLSYLRLSP